MLASIEIAVDHVGIRTQNAEAQGAEYVQLKAIEKWDGKLPQVAGQNTPFINLK